MDDCSTRKRLLCEVDQKCGYSCQLHFLVVCHIQAYYQNRTVILKDLYGIQNLGGHQEKNPRINRFSESYLPFSNCNINRKETTVNINRGMLLYF